MIYAVLPILTCQENKLEYVSCMPTTFKVCLVTWLFNIDSFLRLDYFNMQVYTKHCVNCQPEICLNNDLNVYTFKEILLWTLVLSKT